MNYTSSNINKLKIIDIEDSVWWWKYLPTRKQTIQLRVVRLNKSSLFKEFISILNVYRKLNKYDVVVTQQDSYATFLIALLNTILRRKKCKHFVNEFMTKEKLPTFYSTIKYIFLKFCLSSVRCFICSSNKEIEYYKNQLQLKKCVFSFVPLATDPRFFQIQSNVSGNYIISAGRTGRDYPTLIQAAQDIPFEFKIIADYHNLTSKELPKHINVQHNIPLQDLINLTAKAMFVVLPLQNKPISVGQSVILQAMALGKALIVTKNYGSIDYVEHGVNGLLVSPNDPEELKTNILYLLSHPEKTAELGSNAKRIALEKFNIQTRLQSMCSVIKQYSAPTVSK